MEERNILMHEKRKPWKKGWLQGPLCRGTFSQAFPKAEAEVCPRADSEGRVQGSLQGDSELPTSSPVQLLPSHNCWQGVSKSKISLQLSTQAVPPLTLAAGALWWGNNWGPSVSGHQGVRARQQRAKFCSPIRVSTKLETGETVKSRSICVYGTRLLLCFCSSSLSAPISTTCPINSRNTNTQKGKQSFTESFKMCQLFNFATTTLWGQGHYSHYTEHQGMLIKLADLSWWPCEEDSRSADPFSWRRISGRASLEVEPEPLTHWPPLLVPSASDGLVREPVAAAAKISGQPKSQLLGRGPFHPWAKHTVVFMWWLPRKQGGGGEALSGDWSMVRNSRGVGRLWERWS